MEYSILKLNFTTAVHFGEGLLTDSGASFKADTLFSALYIEALKAGTADEFLRLVESDSLCFSDAFPYRGDTYLLPKPMLYVEPKRAGDSTEKKKFKKLVYLPAEKMSDFLNGNMDLAVNPMDGFGTRYEHTMVRIVQGEDAEPFRAGAYTYAKECGLYVICGYTEKRAWDLLNELFGALSYSGIGGGRSRGFGRFQIEEARPSGSLRALQTLLENRTSKRQILLSVGMASDEELSEVLEGASYLLIKRSGFVGSMTYADEFRKKRDLHVFAAGSCFHSRFSGVIKDVGSGGAHPVYRYAKTIFMGV